MTKNYTKKSSIFLFIIFVMVMISAAFAKYDRHDGSQYSCNEIYADRYMAKQKGHTALFKRLDDEYKRFCSKH
jgi:hypothetical protein